MTRHYPIQGAMIMVIGGLFFAAVNTLTQYIGTTMPIPSSTVAFYQYLFALFFLLPFLFKQGLSVLRTKYLGWHILRVAISMLGIQCWISALMYPIPIWQGIALIMTSPLFATLGAALFLKEKVGLVRLIATLLGFTGAMIILKPWSDDFNPVALLPLLAALCWAIYSLMVKKLLTTESPTNIVVYLFILMTPLNLSVLMKNSDPILLQANEWIFLIILGSLTALAQLAITKAYQLADAAYLQPFDFLKLPLNVFAGWIIFQSVPPGRLWLGASLILIAILSISYAEKNKGVLNDQKYTE